MFSLWYTKGKGLPQQTEVFQAVPGRLRPRIFLTFGTTRVVGRQPYAPAAFTPREIPGTHFQRMSRPQDTWFVQGGGRSNRKKIHSDTNGNRSRDRLTSCALTTTPPQAPLWYINKIENFALRDAEGKF